VCIRFYREFYYTNIYLSPLTSPRQITFDSKINIEIFLRGKIKNIHIKTQVDLYKKNYNTYKKSPKIMYM